MQVETWKALYALQKKYSKHGVSLSELVSFMKCAPPNVSERAAVLGIRLVLGKSFNVTEYFTVEDVAEITGETPSEIKDRMKAMGINPTKVTSSLIDRLS